MKRILIFGLMAAIVSLAIVSCKDDFNEEDFLRLQADLKLKQDSLMRSRDQTTLDEYSEQAVNEYIAAVNEAGDLLAVTMMVRENGVPVPGVTVSLTTSTPNAITAGRAQAIQTGVTDASGNVLFDLVTIGSGTITFRKTGYVGSTATIDFGAPSAPTQVSVPNGTGGTIIKYLVPTKRFEEAIIPMYSATPGAGSTATISGRVIIENNTTNTTQEVPAGVVVRANLVGLVNLIANPFISNFVFEDNSALGVATVAANGNYTMTVPATVAGLNVSLIIPNIEGTTQMAVNGYDNGTGTAVALVNGPEYRDVPTSWGPQAPLGFGNIVPPVAGAKLVFPAAPAAGSGLTFDYARVARGITAGTVSSAAVQQIGGTFYRINSRGNYAAGSIPVVTITGGGGAGATASVNLRTYVSALTVVAAGSGYAVPSNVNINIIRVRQDDSEVSEASISIPVTGSGTLPATIDLTQFSGISGFAPDNQNSLGTDLKSLKITVTGGAGTGATVTGTFETEVQSVSILTPGTGYTTAPSFVFSGGGLNDGSSDHADVQVVEFPVNWTVSPNNTTATDYSIMPSFSITYPNSPLGAIAPETNIDSWSPSGDFEATTSLVARLTIASGDVVKREPGRTLRTVSQSGSQPTIIVTPLVPINARRTFTPANISTLDGSITAFPGGGSNGDGYATPLTVSVVPTITGAPGAGAVFALTTTFDAPSLEYQWTGAAPIMNPGSGYLSNLNQKAPEAAVFPSSPILVQPGKTYTADINYGTGNRKVNIN
jgi:hypothetical protein